MASGCSWWQWEAFRERWHLNDALKDGSYDRQSWGSGSILPGDPAYRITPLAGLGGGEGGREEGGLGRAGERDPVAPQGF